MIEELAVSKLHNTCDPLSLSCKSSADVKPQRTIFGQERAVHAMRFGLDIQDHGFNIFAAGVSGTGRTTAVERFLESIATDKKTPSDWCYVQNFDDNYRPHAIRLPAGRASEYEKDLVSFNKSATADIRAAFEGESYRTQLEATLGDFQEQKEQLFKELCKLKGLTGDQGVMIPASNVNDLMLKQDVLDAVKIGGFHVWAVETIEDGIEVLTGESDTVFEHADKRLREMAKDLAKYS